MPTRASIEAALEAWYDHKRDPGNRDLLDKHNDTIDFVRTAMEKRLGYPLTRTDVRRALGKRFGQWMRENDLPPPPEE